MRVVRVMTQGRGWHVARLMSWDGQVYFRRRRGAGQDLALRHSSRACGSRVARLAGEGHRVVQHGSTATGADSGGLACTLGDGDLRLGTAVDGLPSDGKEKIYGSIP